MKKTLTIRIIRIIMYLRGEGMKDKDLLKLMQKNGWKIDRTKGSHHIMKKGDKTETIPIHGKDVPPGLLNAILKRTGLK